jgi:hypothetical protein
MEYFKPSNSRVIKPFNPAIHEVFEPTTKLKCSVPNCQHPGQYGNYKFSRNIIRVYCDHHIKEASVG